FFFFFQAEDGIRDKLVTGVQTCALPICVGARSVGAGADPQPARRVEAGSQSVAAVHLARPLGGPLSLRPRACDVSRPHRRERQRSEERRVGKEGRGGWSAEWGE